MPDLKTQTIKLRRTDDMQERAYSKVSRGQPGRRLSFLCSLSSQRGMVSWGHEREANWRIPIDPGDQWGKHWSHSACPHSLCPPGRQKFMLLIMRGPGAAS